MKLPVVAIVGRPNVGKSTLFNYIIKKNVAITSKIAGTTRDRLYEFVNFANKDFLLVDTGGIDDIRDDEDIEVGIQDQVKVAITDADLLVFLVDVQAGIMPDDKKVANTLRKSGKPLILVASKVDSRNAALSVAELGQLGMGEALALSALQGRGVDELLRGIGKSIPKVEFEQDRDMISVSFIGKPNVGKSSLVNKLVGEERQIVSAKPGTTRDASSIYIKYKGRTVRFVDTAGVRKRKKVERGIEHFF